jgi:exodeoxyribonuclease-1
MNNDITFLFHDYETFGADPRRDRPAQFAAIRTDINFNKVDEPFMIYAKMQEDTLPSPTACMITKITPSEVNEKGIPEIEFIKKINDEMKVPNTCSLGYNTIQFDDEVTRNTLYRNLLDPYEREYKNNCTRWDLIDVVRMTVALFPETLVLGERDGKPSYKLEELSKANGILHEAAHDALSDVWATIGIAKIIKDKQNKLFNMLFEKRMKNNILEAINTGLPLIIASSFFGLEKKYVDFILPITENPNNKNEFFCVKLSRSKEEIENLINNSSDFIKDLLYSSNDELLEKGKERPGFHVLKINKCPVLLTSNDLKELFDDEDRKNLYNRLGFDMNLIIDSYKYVKTKKEEIKKILLDVYKPMKYPDLLDSDIRIYDGFASFKDKKQFNYFHIDLENGKESKHLNANFDDSRYKEMVFRAIVRNYPEKLENMAQSYKDKWYNHCVERLHNKINDSVNYSFDDFFKEIEELKVNEKYKDSSYQNVLEELIQYGLELKEKYKA